TTWCGSTAVTSRSRAARGRGRGSRSRCRPRRRRRRRGRRRPRPAPPRHPRPPRTRGRDRMVTTMTTAATEPIAAPRRRFDNAAECLNSRGGVPRRRILFDPLRGAATEADLLGLVERGERLCELIDGTLVEKPAGIWEGLIAGLLVRYLWDHVGPRGLGAVF